MKPPSSTGPLVLRPMFVHSVVDDSGLNPSEFRVYGHISRRAGSNGVAWPSIKSIARVCQLHPRTVRVALRALIARNMLVPEARSGETTRYRLTPLAEWRQTTVTGQIQSKINTPVSNSPGSPDKMIQAHPSQLDLGKGYPNEGEKVKEIQHPRRPPRGQSVCGQHELLDSQILEIWEIYPKKVGQPAALRSIEQAVKRHGFTHVLERTQLFAQTYDGEPRYIPYPARWFKDERFNDDPATWRRPAQPISNAKASPPRQFNQNDYNQLTESF